MVKKAKANKQCWMGSDGLRQQTRMVIVAIALNHTDPNAKSHLNDAVKQPAMATGRLCISASPGQGCCRPSPASSASCRRGPTLPSVETCRTGRFEFGLEFCCVFLGRRGPSSIHGAPGLMAKVTPTGGTSPGPGQPFWC